jgi:hypothetical protein
VWRMKLGCRAVGDGEGAPREVRVHAVFRTRRHTTHCAHDRDLSVTCHGVEPGGGVHVEKYSHCAEEKG